MTHVPHRLVLVGSVLVDVLMAVPGLPERGGDVLAGRAATQPGGGFNVLAAARRLGLPAALGGRVGTGPFGARVAAALDAEGVERLLPDAPGGDPDAPAGDTGFCVALVEPHAERTFVTSPGVESELTGADLAALGIRGTDAVYVSGYDLCYPVTGPAFAAWCTTLPLHKGPLLVLDPGPLAADIPPAVLGPVLDRLDILTLSAREADLMTGLAGPDAAGRTLRARLRGDASVIVRLGARGCVLYPPDGTPEHFPAPEVVAVDTTGAGDAHTGALLAELHRTGSLRRAARVATVAAALSVTRSGSATGPDRAALDRLPDAFG